MSDPRFVDGHETIDLDDRRLKFALYVALCMFVVAVIGVASLRPMLQTDNTIDCTATPSGIAMREKYPDDFKTQPVVKVGDDYSTPLGCVPGDVPHV